MMAIADDPKYMGCGEHYKKVTDELFTEINQMYEDFDKIYKPRD